jgi:hypothetical protein
MSLDRPSASGCFMIRTMQFAVYVDWVEPSPLPEALVEAVTERLRPNDESLCVWVDEDAPTVLRPSFDVAAVDLDRALQSGRLIQGDLTSLEVLRGSLTRVVAMDDHGSAEWSASDDAIG